MNETSAAGGASSGASFGFGPEEEPRRDADEFEDTDWGLQETLEEEKAADQMLSDLAEQEVNTSATQEGV